MLCSTWLPSACEIKYELLTLAFKKSLIWIQLIRTVSLPSTSLHDHQLNEDGLISGPRTLKQLLTSEPLPGPTPSHVVTKKPLASSWNPAISVPLCSRRLGWCFRDSETAILGPREPGWQSGKPGPEHTASVCRNGPKTGQIGPEKDARRTAGPEDLWMPFPWVPFRALKSHRQRNSSLSFLVCLQESTDRAKTWNEPLPHETPWANLRNTVLSERSQIQHSTYCRAHL